MSETCILQVTVGQVSDVNHWPLVSGWLTYLMENMCKKSLFLTDHKKLHQRRNRKSRSRRPQRSWSGTFHSRPRSRKSTNSSSTWYICIFSWLCYFNMSLSWLTRNIYLPLQSVWRTEVREAPQEDWGVGQT